jgi:hypothetical protein
VFITPLRKSGILSPPDFQAIFMDIDTIVSPNVQILKELIERLPTLFETGDMKVGDIFCQMVLSIPSTQSPSTTNLTCCCLVVVVLLFVVVVADDDALLRFQAAFLKMYTIYCTKQIDAFKHLERCMKQPKFGAFLKVHHTHTHTLSLSLSRWLTLATFVSRGLKYTHILSCMCWYPR